LEIAAAAAVLLAIAGSLPPIPSASAKAERWRVRIADERRGAFAGLADRAEALPQEGAIRELTIALRAAANAAQPPDPTALQSASAAAEGAAAALARDADLAAMLKRMLGESAFVTPRDPATTAQAVVRLDPDEADRLAALLGLTDDRRATALAAALDAWAADAASRVNALAPAIAAAREFRTWAEGDPAMRAGAGAGEPRASARPPSTDAPATAPIRLGEVRDGAAPAEPLVAPESRDWVAAYFAGIEG
jgi:hypothetical protein